MVAVLSSNKTKQSKTMSALSQDQINWRQFSLNLQEGTRTNESGTRAREEFDETFDIPVSTPTRRNTAEKRATTPRRTEKRTEIQALPASTEKSHENIQKPKTRAARRTIDTITETPPEIKPSQHRERRTDYWVQQDDIRMKRVRKLKTALLEEDRD